MAGTWRRRRKASIRRRSSGSSLQGNRTSQPSSGDAVEEALDPGGGRPRLDSQQLVEPCTLVAVAEPGLADAVGGERNHHGQKQHEEVLPKEAAKPETPPVHGLEPQIEHFIRSPHRRRRGVRREHPGRVS